MRHSFFLNCLLAAVSMTALVPAAMAADAGAVQDVSGNVTIVGADRSTRKAGAREAIQSGDTVITEARSEAVIKMADDSSVILRPNTQFRFTDFKFEKKPSDTSIFAVVRGAARMISGLIGKSNPSSVSVVAKTATIGIRGTDFEVAVIEEDGPQARAGIYNFVRDGGTNIRIATGQNLDVRREQTAFAPERPQPGEDPLQLLRETPIFLQQGGGLDAIIQSITIPPPMIMR